jgi:hypothetical protein
LEGALEVIRMAIAITPALMLVGRGVKTELGRPDTRIMTANETDPSPLPTGP